MSYVEGLLLTSAKKSPFLLLIVLITKERFLKRVIAMKKKALFTFLLSLFLAACTQAYTPEYDNNGQLTLLTADISRNGDIGLADIGLLALAWLEQDCGLNKPCNGADVYPFDEKVDFGDFAVIANVFGLCTDPTNPDCVHVPLTLYEPPTASSPDEGVQLSSGEFTTSVVDMRIPGRGKIGRASCRERV